MCAMDGLPILAGVVDLSFPFLARIVELPSLALRASVAGLVLHAGAMDGLFVLGWRVELSKIRFGIAGGAKGRRVRRSARHLRHGCRRGMGANHTPFRCGARSGWGPAVFAARMAGREDRALKTREIL